MTTPAPPWQRPAVAWSLDGRVLEVACPPVIDLVPMLFGPDVYLVFGTLTDPADRAWLFEQIIVYRSTVDDELVARIADALVFSWCGLPRWLTERVWWELLGRWEMFEGPLTARGVDIAQLPAARATRLAWYTLQERHANDKDKGEGWRMKIEAPPMPPRPAARARASGGGTDGESFMQVMAATGGRAR